jgi:hypothetical protein
MANKPRTIVVDIAEHPWYTKTVVIYNPIQ